MICVAEVGEPMLSGLEGVAGRAGALSPNVANERDWLDAKVFTARTEIDCTGRVIALASLERADCGKLLLPL